MSQRRAAAWNTYLLLTCGLPVAVRALVAGDRQIAVESATVAARIGQHSKVWDAKGAQLITIIGRAWSMERAGDRAGSGLLLRVLARRLFAMSRGPNVTRVTTRPRQAAVPVPNTAAGLLSLATYEIPSCRRVAGLAPGAHTARAGARPR